MTDEAINEPAARAAPDAEDGRRLPHVPGLDGLRAVAVLMVVCTHAVFVFAPQKNNSWITGGFLGVEIFFVLSGFLITSLLLNERSRYGDISLRSFYARRALRLLPAVVVLLAAHFVYAAVTGLDLGVEFRSAVVALFYVSNWFLAAGHPFTAGLQHLWSLSVEEQFYAVWPLVTAALLTWKYWRRAAPGVIAVAILGLALWTDARWKPGTNFLQINVIYTRTDTQAVVLLAGAAAAYVWNRHRLPPRTLAVLATVSSVFIAVCAWELDVTAGFYWRGGLTLIGVAGALVVLAVVDGAWLPARVLAWSPLRAIGRVSYGLYLWHLPIFFAVHSHAGTWPAGVQLAVALAITAACTVASWRFVETPFLRRKARLSSARREGRAPNATDIVLS